MGVQEAAPPGGGCGGCPVHADWSQPLWKRSACADLD